MALGYVRPRSSSSAAIGLGTRRPRRSEGGRGGARSKRTSNKKEGGDVVGSPNTLVRISPLGKKRHWNFSEDSRRRTQVTKLHLRLQPLLNNKEQYYELTYRDFIFILCNDRSYFVNNLMYFRMCSFQISCHL